MIICTIACMNHIAKAMVMACSVKKHNPNVTLVLFLIEKTIGEIEKNCPYFDYVFLAKDIDIPNFSQIVFKYKRYESCSAIRGNALLHVMEIFKTTKVVFLDADVKIYGPLKEVNNLLDSYSIILTPHRLEPEDELVTIWEEVTNLRDGVFNGGFIGIKKTGEGLNFLRWWSKRLADFCYIDYDQGLFLDQKWLNLVPCFFSNYYVLKHPGYNLAAWNFSQRKLTVNKGNIFVNGHRLVFFNFSMLENKWFNQRLQNYVPNLNDPLYRLIDEYKKELFALGDEQFKQIPWSYDYFSSGEKINEASRASFRKNEQLQKKIDNPFLLSNAYFKE